MPRATLKPHQVFYCFSDCGVCESHCPVAERDPSFSPRRIVMKALLGDVESLLTGQEIWRCRSCGKCAWHCPAAVDFLGLIRELREEALDLKAQGARVNEEEGA